VTGARVYMGRDREFVGVLLPVSSLSMRFFAYAAC
jgi:hypothetical protein